MATGAIRLRVPLLNGAIQVGTELPLPTATIEVRKTPGLLSVVRSDGMPLTAQIVHSGNDRPTTRAEVFGEPVASLDIRRIIAASGARWRILPPASAHRPAALVQLIETIVSFSLTRQQRRRPDGARYAYTSAGGSISVTAVVSRVGITEESPSPGPDLTVPSTRSQVYSG